MKKIPAVELIINADGKTLQLRVASELRYIADLLEHGLPIKSGGILIARYGEGHLKVTSDAIFEMPEWMK